jgi:SAM-dependent MidA family methyltransferase
VDFPTFMARALYDPQHGYYARGAAQVGRGGDFFTSVSVGPVFGHLLARRFLREWRETGGRWRILEIGAHDGSLAADVIAALAVLDSEAVAYLEYAIAEPLARLRECQRAKLHGFAAAVRWVEAVDELAGDPLPGIVFGNELLDALPFHVVTRRNGCWHEDGVASDLETPGSLAWCDLGPVDGGPLADAVARIDASRLPDDYRTEVRTNFGALHHAIARCLTRGRVVWFDYGFAREDYYDPARVNGTLRTFSRHVAGEDPLAAPGAADITAHVDFTAVAEAAEASGFSAAGMCSQGAWLTREARGWLMEMEGNPDATAIRQFQTLTHPAHLGAKFQVIELELPEPGAT